METSPLLNVYRRSDVVMARGEGVYLYDDAGKRYLDFAAGIATNALGHAHPALVKALQAQAATLWHCSNAYHTPPLDDFAAALTQASGFDKVFFGSSGTEAVEAALKILRRYQYMRGETKRTRFIVAEGGFHGRTMGALSACGHARSREGFEPLVPGFDVVPFNDIAALEAAITPETAAIFVETIQGEGGVRAHSPEYLQAARRLADAHGLLLALDEIQCGYGRTGTLFAFETMGVRPDLVTVGKGIGNGFPLAAVLMTERAASGMTPGSHGSTYGSNPLAMAVGGAVLGILTAPGFLAEVRRIGAHLQAELQSLAHDFPHLYAEVRGTGLMLGLHLQPGVDKYALATRLRESGLLVTPAVTEVLRIVPPLIIDETKIAKAMRILRMASNKNANKLHSTT
jgi:acetylornithine/N-succinyldiaminopimelate aminotransferase